MDLTRALPRGYPRMDWRGSRSFPHGVATSKSEIPSCGSLMPHPELDEDYLPRAARPPFSIVETQRSQIERPSPREIEGLQYVAPVELRLKHETSAPIQLSFKTSDLNMSFEISIPEKLTFQNYIAVMQTARAWADGYDRKVRSYSITPDHFS